MNITFSVQGFTFNDDVKVTPYKPAKTYGPPENCYPEEGGEIEFSENFKLVDGDLLELIDSKLDIGLIEEAAYIAAMEWIEDYKNEAAISAYESRRDAA